MGDLHTDGRTTGDLNALPLAALFERLNPPDSLRGFVERALAEDLGGIPRAGAGAGDVTSGSIIDEGTTATGAIVARQAGIAAGLAVCEAIIEVAGVDVRVSHRAADGDRVQPGDVLAELTGELRGMLTIERTLLNIIGRLSGIATQTRAYVDAAAGAGPGGKSPAICDTRKTTPGMRMLEKYAVRCGGGMLHRIGLFDAALYKDNHIAHLSIEQLPDAIAEAAAKARAMGPLQFVEVEVDTLEQLRALLTLDAGIMDIVLLDNMPPDVMRDAVAMRDEHQPGLLLEASGGITLDTVKRVAESGVDRISVGAITHSVQCLDIGLDIGADVV